RVQRHRRQDQGPSSPVAVTVEPARAGSDHDDATDDDAAPRDGVGAHTEPVGPVPRGPRLQAEILETVPLAVVDDLLARTGDDHAPPGPGDLIDAVDLEYGRSP